MKKAFTVEITRNKTGETETIETDGILATIDIDEGTKQIFMTECNAICVAAMISTCRNGLKKVVADNPVAATLAEVVEAVMAKDGENNE